MSPDDQIQKSSKFFMGKTIVSKTGKRFGEVGNLTFEIRTGELIHMIIKNPTGYCEGLDLEKDKNGNTMIPFSSVVATGDFIVVAEEDII